MSDIKSARPLSPHLSIYRWAPTMMMSVAHRLTGMALYGGTVLFVWWLVALASGPEAFSWASGFFGSIFGRVILFVYSFVLLHHMTGGVRHLIWDTGTGLQKTTATRIATVTPLISLGLTALLWIAVWIV
ncbi:succinate dehydrogenase, cytochrome b556 subunit [Aureimonas mangrovi]|uniref:succinate dehydrogenase, cytochrome b556 subunit n=1 Tax=Aureimonas mangrovi TaxID=2758041 RepID=UPI00163D62AF|nr:succinate dehydrogenase, cytochrome b556 subunit [Aureimonas mangrovi]